MGTYNIHAGHNPQGMIACGASGFIDESYEARMIKDRVIERLRNSNHTVYDCTCDNGANQNDVLRKIVAKCNQHNVDVDVSIHLNSGRGDYEGDGAIGGSEVWYYTDDDEGREYAQRIVDNLAELGFTNRGAKPTSNLYVLNNTHSTAVLVEVCFVDDADDFNLYNPTPYNALADAIINGITDGYSAPEPQPEPEPEKHIKYRGHVQDYGWMDEVMDGETAGTTGEEKRLECLKTYFDGISYSMRVHISERGWTDWSEWTTGELTMGTEGEGLAIEAVEFGCEIRLMYRLHVAELGWLPWVYSDQDDYAGTVGRGLRAEAIQIKKA